MRNLVAVLIANAFALSGCASHEGLYEPDCAAFEGETIELVAGQFVWQRFTDQVVIGDNGKPVDAFPNFPKRGAYKKSGNDIVLAPDEGNGTQERRTIKRIADETYLLSEAEHQSYLEQGSMPRCALRLTPIVEGGSE